MYFIVLASQPCMIWTVSRDPLLGDPSMFFSVWAAWVTPPDLLRGFSSCRQVLDHFPLVWQGYGGIFLFPLVPVMTSLPKNLDITAFDWKRCPWKFFLCLLFLQSCDKEGLLSSLPCSLAKLTLTAVFPHYLLGVWMYSKYDERQLFMYNHTPNR